MNNITLTPKPCGREIHDPDSGRFVGCGFKRPSGYVIRCNNCATLGFRLMVAGAQMLSRYQNWPACLAANICLAALLEAAVVQYRKREIEAELDYLFDLSRI